MDTIRENRTVVQIIKKFPASYEERGPLPSSKEPTTARYPKPDDTLHIPFEIHFNIILPATYTLSKLSLLYRFSDLNENLH
jgi:hypothetical protein